MKGEPVRGSRVLQRLLRAGTLGFVALLGCCTGAAVASPSAGSKVVRYHGYRMVVPAAWPVYGLTSDPAVCVRFNRHAVYLGRPSSVQRCPAHAVGRTEAILIEPLAARDAAGAGAGPALAPVIKRGAQPRRGSEAQLIVANRGVIVTATWREHPSVVQRALGTRATGAIAARPASSPRGEVAKARSAQAAATPGAVYTGLGFDACSAPSLAQMSAWGASPFRAAGIYVGGTNMACTQSNLTAAWVSQESAAGWHLIPTYVGLQAPTNSCGCASIIPGQASAEGTAAAVDAVGQAAALGIGTGNPIYLDMEAYPRGGSNTAAVLAFVSAWTVQLHAEGYESGVYSSGASGIQDLVAQVGTGFQEPDDIWIADWNGEQTTSDPYVPAADWPAQQRLHQYNGGRNDTYGGVTLNIDGNYLNGATAAAGAGAGVVTVAPFPTLTIAPTVDGAIGLNASWPGATGVVAWLVFAGDSSSGLTQLNPTPTPGSQMAMAIRSTFPYFAVQAIGSAGQVLATTPVLATPAHIVIYGHSVFSPSPGLGGLPVGCFTGSPCHITTTISAGRTVIASAGREFVAADSNGILYFKLSPAGRTMLARAPGHRLSVKLTARDLSGVTATTTLTLVRFQTSGRGPSRSLGEPGTLRIVGATDFVSSGWVGGVLAGCSAGAPCEVTTTITVGRTTIARSGPQVLGANELGYLIVRLTPQGHAMLLHARGNQLGAHLTITDGSATANANIALVRFSA
jgi:hypothetical protein